MAAFYFDKITIKNTGVNTYTFDAVSNPTKGTSQNATSMLKSRELEYTLPALPVAGDEVVYPPVALNFANFEEYDAMHLNVKYPQYLKTDYKGEFSIKDTDFPPPNPGRHYFEVSTKMRTLYKIQSFASIILNRFTINKMILTRVMDAAYTIELDLTETVHEYIPDRISIELDKDKGTQVILVCVKKAATANGILKFNPTFMIDFNKQDIYAILIYDLGGTQIKDIDWTTMVKKNAHIGFD